MTLLGLNIINFKSFKYGKKSILEILKLKYQILKNDFGFTIKSWMRLKPMNFYKV